MEYGHQSGGGNSSAKLWLAPQRVKKIALRVGKRIAFNYDEHIFIPRRDERDKMLTNDDGEW